MSRGAGIVLLLVLAGGVLGIGIGTLSNLFADYKDSSDATYLLLGLPLVAISVAIFARILSLTSLRWSRPSFVIAVASCAVALAVAVLGLFLVDESFWQLVALVGAVSIIVWILGRTAGSASGPEGRPPGSTPGS